MPTVGIVLGAGGVVGGAYHAGALRALDEAGWDARTAKVIVGTSAGSLMGAALRAGLSPADQFARMTDAALSPEGDRLLGGTTSVAEEFMGRRPLRSVLPANPQLAATALLPPWSMRPLTALAGLLPAGSVPTTPIGDRVRLLLGNHWPAEPLWIAALRLRDGARIVFGRGEADPEPDPGTAVEASSAVPGFMAPVCIGTDSYVDGGAHSPTNADLLAEAGLDVVIVISPMSAPWNALRPVPSIGARALASWVLDREVRALRAAGSQVLVLQPTAEDLRVMGHSSMDAKRRGPVAEQARSTTAQRLEHPAAIEVVSALTN